MSARKFWIRPAPSGSAIGALVAAVQAHEGEVFRQRGEHGVEPRRLGEKAPGRLEIGVDVVAGSHLDCRDSHADNLPRTLHGFECAAVIPGAVPLHAPRFGGFGPAAARDRAAQRGPGARQARTRRRGHGARRERRPARSRPSGRIRAPARPTRPLPRNTWSGRRPGALHVGELDLAIGERRIRDQLVVCYPLPWVSSSKWPASTRVRSPCESAGQLSSPAACSDSVGHSGGQLRAAQQRGEVAACRR